MKQANITYQHGTKYTKNWVGSCKYENGGGFSLSNNYNGGRFTSKKDIERYIYNELTSKLEELGYEIESIKLL